ncbi:hypothetical protein T492DRAFT_1021282 [Pavlovales sp. CCMP2436]|nr:hypothetical protein T492DRAFT_1021282 [Pavlovales sp. CCMP2436]
MSATHAPATHVPFHEGEIAVQNAAAGAKAATAFRVGTGPSIRPFMPLQHLVFFKEAPFLVAACWLRASILQRPHDGADIFEPIEGARAFALPPGVGMASDPLEENIRCPDAPVGILGIKLVTRRRNRVKGRAENPEHGENPAGGSVRMRVKHSFGNCPKYITARTRAERLTDEMEPFERSEILASSGSATGEPAATLLAAASALFPDSRTLFIATGSSNSGVDVSHRGGASGFAKVRKDEVAVLLAKKSVEELAFGQELTRLTSEGVRISVAITQSPDGEAAAAAAAALGSPWLRGFAGRPSVEMLAAALLDDAEIACGRPAGFGAAIEALLESAGHGKYEAITESFEY